MSQIFDAIHRSEAGRRGVDPLRVESAPELLEVAERQLALEEGENKGQPRPAGKEFGPFPTAPVMLSPDCKLVCVTDGESLAAEKFRFLGVRLRHLQQKRDIKRLLITSSLPEEGKSTVAANLAAILAARAQQKVLLVEGDLRRPTIARQFGLGKRPGLSEWLQGETATDMNICRLESLKFWLLPAGSPPAEPLALMQSERLTELMDQLTSWFDWIVIDCPPVLPLGDTSVWMRQSDAVLLVVRPGRTEQHQLQLTLQALEQSKLLGALVNGSTQTASNHYYRYYHGG